MTPERLKLLEDLGFKWSLPTPSRTKKGKVNTEEEQNENDPNAGENAVEVRDQGLAQGAQDGSADTDMGNTMTGSEDAKELDAPEQGTDTDPNAAAVEV
jgi:hypothetical protein